MFQHIKDLVELDDSGPKSWKLLCDVIQPNTQPMVIVLEKELAGLSMRPGDDVKSVLDKINDTYARMAAAGSNVSQIQLWTKIISVLDNSWDNLTLNTQQDQWTPEWLQQQILQEDSGAHAGLRSSPPLVLYSLGEYSCCPGCDGHYHHSWGSACVDLHVYTDGSSPGHFHSSAKVESVHTGYRASSGSCVCSGVASSQVAPPCLCRLLLHQTLLWHHCLGNPSLPCLRGTHSCLLLSGLPRSLPPLPPSPSPLCLPCIEGRQRAAPHSSSFPSTSAPLQTLHMDVGGEFSSDLLREFCRGEGILQSFTLPDSPQKNGIAERRIGFVMEVARTSMIHAAAPHFLWPFAVRYAVHQLNLWPLWGSRAFVRDPSAAKLSARAIPCVFLGFVLDALGWQFYHPTSRRVLPSQDLTFDKSVPFYRLFPYRSAPLPPPPLFLAPGPPPVDPLPPQGPAPSGVSQVDPPPGAVPGEVAVDPGSARGTASGGAEPGGAEPGDVEIGGAELGGAETGGAEPKGAGKDGVEPGGAASEGAESGRAEPWGAASSGGSAGASSRLSPQQLRAGATTGAGVPGGTAATSLGGARAQGTGAAETGGVGGIGAGDPTESRAAGAGGSTLVTQEQGELELEALAREALELEELELLALAALCGRDLAAAVTAALTATTSFSLHCTVRRSSERREPVCTARRVPHSRPPPVPGTHAMALRPSSVPLRVSLPAPPESSLPKVPDTEGDRARATSSSVSRLFATVVTDPSFEDVKFLESLYYKEWKQQQQKLPTTPLIIEADEVQRPSRQVQVTVSDEEISAVTEDGGEPE
ncbi:unnamed protein product, partial [Closterium sp. NIES-54]